MLINSYIENLFSLYLMLVFFTGMLINFMKYSSFQLNKLGIGYNTESLMHYHSYAYSIGIGRPTIVERKTGVLF